MSDPRAGQPAQPSDLIDVGKLVEAVHVARWILSQAAFCPYDGGEVSPGPRVRSDEEILDWVARDAETASAPSCVTAKSGRRPMASATSARRARCSIPFPEWIIPGSDVRVQQSLSVFRPYISVYYTGKAGLCITE